MHALIMYR